MTSSSHLLPLIVVLIARPALASLTYTGVSTINSGTAVGVIVGLVILFAFSIIVCTAATRRATRRRQALQIASEDLEYNRRARLSSRLNQEYAPDSRYPTKPPAVVLPPYFYKSARHDSVSVPPPSYQDSVTSQTNRSESRL